MVGNEVAQISRHRCCHEARPGIGCVAVMSGNFRECGEDRHEWS